MRTATVALVLVGVLTGCAVTEGTTTTAPVATQAPLAETNVYDARVEALIEDATAALRTLSWQGVEWSWKSVEWSSLDRFDAGVLYHAGAIVGGAGQRVGDMPGVTIMSRQQQAEIASALKVAGRNLEEMGYQVGTSERYFDNAYGFMRDAVASFQSVLDEAGL